MKKYIILLAVSAISILTSAKANGGGDAWLGVAASICLIQDSKYAELPLGASFNALPGFKSWRSSLSESTSSCIRQKKMVPDSLCKQIMKQSPEAKPDQNFINSLSLKYASDIEKIFNTLEECENADKSTVKK